MKIMDVIFAKKYQRFWPKSVAKSVFCIRICLIDCTTVARKVTVFKIKKVRN